VSFSSSGKLSIYLALRAGVSLGGKVDGIRYLKATGGSFMNWVHTAIIMINRYDLGPFPRRGSKVFKKGTPTKIPSITSW